MNGLTRAGMVAWVLAAVLAGTAGAQEQQWLRYRVAKEPSQVLGSYQRGQVCQVTADAPQGPALPKLTGEKPLFAKWTTPMVEAGFLWIALDQSKKTGAHDRLYLDTDGDGSLADETSVEAAPASYSLPADYERAGFGPVKVLFKGPDGPVTYHLNVLFYSYRDRTLVYLRPAGWYEGSVRLADKEYGCRLLDYDGNGVFNDVSLAPDDSDRIELDIEGDGKYKTFFMGRYIQPVTGGPYYVLNVARDGACIGFTPAGELPMGTVRVPDDAGFMELTGENGHFRRGSADRPVRVPAGTYRFKYIDFKRTDEKGVPWELMASTFPEALTVEVKENEITQVAIGEPWASSLRIQGGRTQVLRTDPKTGKTVAEDVKSDRTFNISQWLKGRNVEQLQLQCNGESAPAPKLRITNADKSYDRSFSFEYG